MSTNPDPIVGVKRVEVDALMLADWAETANILTRVRTRAWLRKWIVGAIAVIGLMALAGCGGVLPTPATAQPTAVVKADIEPVVLESPTEVAQELAPTEEPPERSGEFDDRVITGASGTVILKYSESETAQTHHDPEWVMPASECSFEYAREFGIGILGDPCAEYSFGRQDARLTGIGDVTIYEIDPREYGVGVFVGDDDCFKAQPFSNGYREVFYFSGVRGTYLGEPAILCTDNWADAYAEGRMADVQERAADISLNTRKRIFYCQRVGPRITANWTEAEWVEHGDDYRSWVAHFEEAGVHYDCGPYL